MIVERCRRPGVSTQTYLTPASRYRRVHLCAHAHAPTHLNTRVTHTCARAREFLHNRTQSGPREPLSHSTRSDLSIDIFIQWWGSRIGIFYRISARKLLRIHFVVFLASLEPVHFLYLLDDTMPLSLRRMQMLLRSNHEFERECIETYRKIAAPSRFTVDWKLIGWISSGWKCALKRYTIAGRGIFFFSFALYSSNPSNRCNYNFFSSERYSGIHILWKQTVPWRF